MNLVPFSCKRERSKSFDEVVDHSPGKKNQGDIIWSDDVENAFREALAIIPKLGLKKNKICKVCLGRNQYISIYIEFKTGKKRTAKQISSHIQTIYRANKNPKITKLFKEGAPNTPEAHKRFHEIFTLIINKQGIPSSLTQSPTSSSSQTVSPLSFYSTNDVTVNNEQVSPSISYRAKNILENNDSMPASTALTKRDVTHSINFSSANKLASKLDPITLDYALMESFPNAIVNLNSVRELISKSVNVYIENVNDIPVPLIYQHSKIAFAFNDFNLNTIDGDDVKLVINNKENYNLGLLTLVYYKKERIEESIELIDSNIVNLNYSKMYWKRKINDLIIEQEKFNWKDEAQLFTLEQYVVTVSTQSSDKSVHIEKIQSMILTDFELVDQKENVCSSLKSCIGFNFDLNHFLTSEICLTGNCDISPKNSFGNTNCDQSCDKQKYYHKESTSSIASMQAEQMMSNSASFNIYPNQNSLTSTIESDMYDKLHTPLATTNEEYNNSQYNLTSKNISSSGFNNVSFNLKTLPAKSCNSCTTNEFPSANDQKKYLPNPHNMDFSSNEFDQSGFEITGNDIFFEY